MPPSASSSYGKFQLGLYQMSKAPPFKFHPKNIYNRAGVLICENFQPGYRDLAHDRASPPSHIHYHLYRPLPDAVYQYVYRYLTSEIKVKCSEPLFCGRRSATVDPRPYAVFCRHFYTNAEDWFYNLYLGMLTKYGMLSPLSNRRVSSRTGEVEHS